jgi:two-component system invasion response regulator UvrY
MLVDDHDLVRTGLKRLLADASDIEVIGEAPNGEQAIELARKLKPDVVLMDINMPGIGGLEATRKITRLRTPPKVIVVTIHKEGPFPSNLMKAGAFGYLTKGVDIDEIIKAIRTVYGGQRYISAEVAQTLAIDMLTSHDINPFEKLSSRELQVLLMLLQGDKVSEISDQLCLSNKTISTYRYRIYEKLNVNNDRDMTKLAMRYDMLGENYNE